MTIGVRLLATGGKEELHYEENPFAPNGKVLVVMSPAQVHGHFKAASRTDAGTTIIVQPRPGLSVAITDILISGEKQPSSSVIVQFTDGVDTEIVVNADQADAVPTMDADLSAYFYGWADARIEMVTGAGDATVTIGYLHSDGRKTYAEWNAER